MRRFESYTRLHLLYGALVQRKNSYFTMITNIKRRNALKVTGPAPPIVQDTELGGAHFKQKGKKYVSTYNYKPCCYDLIGPLRGLRNVLLLQGTQTRKTPVRLFMVDCGVFPYNCRWVRSRAKCCSCRCGVFTSLRTRKAPFRGYRGDAQQTKEHDISAGFPRKALPPMSWRHNKARMF